MGDFLNALSKLEKTTCGEKVIKRKLITPLSLKRLTNRRHSTKLKAKIQV